MNRRTSPGRPTPPAQESGFTLVELLITMMIIAILSAIAIPGMRNYVQNQTLSSAAAQLVTSLNYAKSEAIKEDQPGGVTICASNGVVAAPVCSGGATWAQGWFVASSAAPAVSLQTVGPLAGGTTVSTLPVNNTLTFQSNGTLPNLAGLGAGVQVVEFKFCDSRGAAYAREVEVTIGGIIQASSTLGRDVAGVALACP